MPAAPKTALTLRSRSLLRRRSQRNQPSKKRERAVPFEVSPEVGSREELRLSLDCDGAGEKPSCDGPPSVEERFGNAEIATHAANGALF